ncbi:MAG TPA: hypothetical protein VFC53_09385 [Dehalococcoidia bacterium]|nr:hypothetical protein [Dehalococcoidia bacterium]
MDLTLERNEIDVLHRVLTQYLSDLRMEVRDTEDYDFRQRLKREEETVKAILDRLGSVPAQGAPSP